jgi:hypothetical protein
MHWAHHTVALRDRIGLVGEVDTTMVVHTHTAAWAGHCRIQIHAHMHVLIPGCCLQRLQRMETLMVVHAIVTVVCLNRTPTQTPESSHRQDRYGTAATSTPSSHGQRTILVGEL